MKHIPGPPEIKIAILYVIIGGAWILFSDHLAAWLFTNPSQLSALQTYKGALFIVFTATLLFYLIRKSRHSQESIKQDYADIFQTAEEGIFRSSPDGRFILVNPAMARIYGYSSAQEMLEMVEDINTQIHLYPHSRERFTSLLREQGSVQHFESQNLTHDKTVIWTSTNAHEVRDEKGNTKYYEGFVTDITRQKKAELALRDTELQYRTLVEQMPAAAYTGNADNYENYFTSPQILSITGYTDEEWKNDPELLMHIIHPEDSPAVRKESERALQSETPFDMEYRIIAKNGQVLWVHDMAALIHDEEGKPKYWQGLLFDITSQKNTEELNKLREARYHMVIEHASDGIMITDAQGNLLEVNKQTCAMLGYEKDELLSRDLQDLLSREEAALRPFKFQELQAGRMVRMERTLLQKNGASVLVELNSKSLPDGNLIHIARDISHRRLLQETLIRSEKRFRALIENSMDVIALFSTQGRVIYQSPSSVHILGYTLDEAIGRDAFRIILEEDQESARKAFHSLLKSPASSLKMEIRCFHKDGSVRWLDIMGTNHLLEPGIEAVVVNYRDITARKNADGILKRQLAELTILHSVALIEATARNMDELIRSATEIISNTLHPDNCGVLLVSRLGNSLRPHPSYFGSSAEDLLRVILPGTGICGTVAQTGRAMRINDTTQNDLYIAASEGIYSELCVPIFVASKIIGVLNIESTVRDAYTEADERLLNTIAGGLASTIERLQLFEHEQKLYEQAEVLREATAALTESLEINSIYAKILSVSARLVGYTSASIELINGRYAEIVAQRGLPESFEYIGKPYEVEPGKWNKDIWTPVIVPNVQVDARFIKFPHTQYIRSWMGIPLIAQEKLIGFLNFDSEREDFFTREDAALLQTFANQAAVAIENSRHFQQESRRARIIEAIVDIANETTAHHDTKLVLNKIAQRAMELLIANNVAVYLLQPDHRTIKVVSAHGIYSDELLAHTIELHQGITGNLIAEGRAEIINATSRDARKINVPGTPKDDHENETMMSAPLMLHGNCVGAINVWRLANRGPFSQMELDFLISIAHQTSIALEASHLLEEAMRNAQETSAIVEVGKNITSTLELDVVLERIAYYARSLLSAETSAIYLSAPTRDVLVAIAAVGNDADEIKSDPVAVGDGILGSIAQHGVGEIVNNTEKDPRTLIVKGTESRSFEHIMGVPILSKDQLTGLLVVWRHGKRLEFHAEHLDFLARLAQQAAIAIENARLFEAEQRRRKEADILREATIALTANMTLQQTYKITLDSLARLIIHDRATLELIHENADGHTYSHEVVATRNFQRNTVGDRYVINYDEWSGIEGVKRPLIVNNIPDDVRFRQFSGLDGTLSWMGIPLIAQDRLIGYLSLDSETPEYFTEEHVAIAQTLANQAATAIENARLFQSEKKRRKDAETLSRATAALTNSMEISHLLETIMDWLYKIAPYDSASITLNRNDNFEIAASRGLPNDTDFSKVHFPINYKWTTIANMHQPLQIHDAQQDERFEKVAGTEYIRGWMGVPMFTQNALIGFINLDSRTPGAFDNDEQAASVQTFANQAATAIDNTHLLENLQLSNQELYLAYDITLEGWGKALELRDKETQGHTRRVTDLTLKLARQMGISEAELIHVRRGVLLHDIGKMGVPDSILHKTGPLTKSEMIEMKRHTQYAYDLIHPIAYLRPAIDIAYNHHEWWDGNGYPRQLKGEEIPLSARIFAIIDVWDALLSDRPYRKAWPRKKVIEYIRDLSGKQFDPQVVTEFFKMIDQEIKPKVKPDKKVK